MPLASCVALEEKLKARFALDEVSVVPSVPDPDTQQQVIGEAAGCMLEPLLQDGIGLGVGWGRTLREAARRMRAHRHPASWVTSLMGGLTRGSGTNTFEVATEFARLIGAECYYVAAPIYCPSVESRSTLLTHYGLADVMRRAREANVALLSCGDLSPRSLLASTHIVSESLPDLRAAGAIGDILGTFLDEYGRARRSSAEPARDGAQPAGAENLSDVDPGLGRPRQAGDHPRHPERPLHPPPRHRRSRRRSAAAMRHAPISWPSMSARCRRGPGCSTRGGRLIAARECVFELLHPLDDHAVYRMDDIWAAVCAATRRDCRCAGSCRCVAGIAIDATSSTYFEAEGERPLDGDADVICWMDHRGEREAEEIGATGDRYLDYVGGTVSPEMYLPKILWLKRHTRRPGRA